MPATPVQSLLDRVRSGDAISAKSHNAQIDALNALVAGVAPPQQQVKKKLQLTMSAMEVVSFPAVFSDGTFPDYITCKLILQGGVDSQSETKVALPPMLRSSIVSRDGLTFLYQDDSTPVVPGAETRQANDGSSTEEQVIVPSYVAGDRIYAMRAMMGGTGVTAEVGGTGAAVLWQDLNIDARAWAEK